MDSLRLNDTISEIRISVDEFIDRLNTAEVSISAVVSVTSTWQN